MNGSRKFYFVRHGLTDWNAESRFQGRNDIPLNEEGIAQAKTAALRLEQSSAKTVLSSPLSRARQAAEIIAGDKRKLIVWDELTEQCFGDWERKIFADIRTQYREEYKAWRMGKADVPGGETEAEIYARAKTVVEKLGEIEDEETIIVSHGSILRLILLACLKSEYSSIFWRIRLDNCSITTAEIRDGKLTLLNINDTLHFKIKSENEIRNLPLA